MFPSVHQQLLDRSSRYSRELRDQFEDIERVVESGRPVTILLIDGDRQTTLEFAGGKVSASESEATPGATPPFSLAQNKSLRAMVSGRYAFDLVQAESEMSSADAAMALAAAARLRVDDDRIRERLAAGLPLTSISQMGSDEYFLTEDCSYRANDGYTITAFKGFRTDLASIPRLLLPLVTVRELSITAPTFHDLVYRTAGRVVPPLGAIDPAMKTLERKDADDLFLELMTREKVGFFRRNLAYAAVRLGGRSAWAKT